MEHRMTPARWFQYPFRIFFLSLAAWSILVIPLWLGNQLAGWKFSPALMPLLWHEHEMIFGLLMPAVAGFLLTAVCVWTKTERLHGASLFGLWLVWFGGRAANHTSHRPKSDAPCSRSDCMVRRSLDYGSYGSVDARRSPLEEIGRVGFPWH